jgi:hypothetical protein
LSADPPGKGLNHDAALKHCSGIALITVPVGGSCAVSKQAQKSASLCKRQILTYFVHLRASGNVLVCRTMHSHSEHFFIQKNVNNYFDEVWPLLQRHYHAHLFKSSLNSTREKKG